MGNKIQIKEGSELSEKIGQLKMQSSEGGNQTVTICHGLKMLNKNTLLSPHPVRDASLGRTEDTPPKTASRQGCILNRMQKSGVTAFSTERCIPDGMQFRKFRSLQVIYFSCHKMCNRFEKVTRKVAN